MKVYSKELNKIIELPPMINVNGINKYTSKIKDEELNSIGYYKVKLSSKPTSKYYTYLEYGELKDNVYVINYKKEYKTLDDVKSIMLKELSKSFKEFSSRPPVDTGLGFSVDGSIDDIKKLEIGLELGLLSIVDSEGAKHDVTKFQYEGIIKRCKQHGLDIYKLKWKKEEEIKSLTSVDECIEYENTEVKYTDENNEELTRTINKTKHWDLKYLGVRDDIS